MPALLRSLGEPGLLRFLEFFTVNIRNRNTREAYGRAARNFLRWCEERGIAELKDVQPVHVAAHSPACDVCVTSTDQASSLARLNVPEGMGSAGGRLVSVNPGAAIALSRSSLELG